MRAANDAFRFLLEMAVLVSLGYWGQWVTDSAFRWVLMLGAPLFVAAVWAKWVAAKSPSAAHDPLRLLLEVAAFGSGVAALAWAGRTTPATTLAALAALHLALTFVLDQRSPTAVAAPVEQTPAIDSYGGEIQ